MNRTRKTLGSTSPSKTNFACSILLTIGSISYGSASADTFGDFELPSWATERRIIGTNNLESVESNQVLEFYDYARVVARLETPDGLGYCSGSRVGENLFLTNFHCQESLDCENIVVHMGYEKGLSKNQQGIFQCVAVLAANETHDYALLEVKWVGTQGDLDLSRGTTPEASESESNGTAGLDDFTATAADFPIASLYIGALDTLMPIVVPSHPRGRLKEIDKSSDCKILSTDIIEVSMRETMTHSCDTEGGSSGSPIMNRATGAILGLHWGGISQQNFMIPMNLVVADLKTVLTPDQFAQLSITQ